MSDNTTERDPVDERDQGWPWAVVAERPVAQCLAIHDFVPVDLPIDAVLGAFVNFVTPELLGGLVRRAWVEEQAELPDRRADDEPSKAELQVMLGGHRSRADAVVLPVRWISSGSWLPPLVADLEIVSYGPSRTHLHLLGHSQLHPSTEVLTARASLEQRLAVALVRRVLADLAAAVTGSSGWNLDRPGRR